MNYNCFLIAQALFLTSFMSYSPSIKTVLVNTWVVKLPKDNRCIFLFDLHAKKRDERDVQQLKTVLRALVDREETTSRPLHILTESTLDQVKHTQRDIICSLEGEMTHLEIVEGQEFKHTSIESVEVRKLFAAVIYILFLDSTRPYNENIYLYHDSEKWQQGSLSFNDLLIDFQKHQKAATLTCKSLSELCDNSQEKENIEILRKRIIEETNEQFIKYSHFLKNLNIEVSTAASIYKETYHWEKSIKEKLEIILIECFSPFFDLNAFARIFTLHKQSSSLDIVLIAGSGHCWRILHNVGWALSGEDVYSETTELEDSECLPTQVLYNVLQEKTPIEEASYESCLLF